MHALASLLRSGRVLTNVFKGRVNSSMTVIATYNLKLGCHCTEFGMRVLSHGRYGRQGSRSIGQNRQVVGFNPAVREQLVGVRCAVDRCGGCTTGGLVQGENNAGIQS